jgi:hypothetical protein
MYFHGHKMLFLNSQVQIQRFLSLVGGDSKPVLDKFLPIFQNIYRSTPKVIGVVIITTIKTTIKIGIVKLGPMDYFAVGTNSDTASSFSHRSITLVEDLSVVHNSHKTVVYKTSKYNIYDHRGIRTYGLYIRVYGS